MRIGSTGEAVIIFLDLCSQFCVNCELTKPSIQYRTIGLMDFIHRPVFKRRKQKNTTFRRLDLSPSSNVWDKIKPTQMDPLEGASLNHFNTIQVSKLN
jgi:hypothetical protein